MATTTNYGWTTPDDTALVKDGASAIRTLGSSVDTTTKNLNPETTLGDISFRSSTSNVNTRLGIGSTSQVLTVTGGVPVWATPAAGGGETLISTTSLTGASVTLSSIPGTYNDLKLVIKDVVPATDGSTLEMRINSDSTANRYNDRGWNTTNGRSKVYDMDRFLDITGALPSSGTPKNQTVIFFYDYANSSTFKNIWAQSYSVDFTNSAQFANSRNTHYYNQTTAFTAINLFLSSGNFSSGTALLYGVK